MEFNFNIIYEDKDVLVVNKPAGMICFPEGDVSNEEKTLIDELIKERPELKNAGEQPRYGVAHRLDKDTSGVLLIAKSDETLDFFQKKFKNREVDKKYLALVVGVIRDEQGTIDTLIGREKKGGIKQKVYFPFSPDSKGKRNAITDYKVIESFKDYSLVEVEIKTGRKHQIRCHFTYLQHPIAGDNLYGFKNQSCPEGLKRQFLHAYKLKIKLPNGEEKEFKSDLSEDLKKTLNNIK